MVVLMMRILIVCVRVISSTERRQHEPETATRRPRLGCHLSVSAWSTDPVKIGFVLPMSGPFAAYGKQIEHGVKLYLATNGDTFGGRKVESILKDDSRWTAGDVSKRLAQELVVKDKVDI